MRQHQGSRHGNHYWLQVIQELTRAISRDTDFYKLRVLHAEQYEVDAVNHLSVYVWVIRRILSTFSKGPTLRKTFARDAIVCGELDKWDQETHDEVQVPETETRPNGV
ncbi:uncharacterized protein PHALS_03250 [Plasmopara halstedii]|uniref:Uncharacterized protein n=1 Tax=Plasmopara halstedii TaxID=4781 RepID=A0A0N7L7B9_PLAHL|nr:uncharacterized protein PHALS_03250 [Plasmopara halstedii]CEG46643.1 hypothetical protein PHALS_03250 [Plasmopara halstedii]|eukprot:XP_024583012.1 hypothetical protein PHALS_03250 [Plasmopara halstedii]